MHKMLKRFTIAALALAILVSPSYALEVKDFKSNPIPVNAWCDNLFYTVDIRKGLEKGELQYTLGLIEVFLKVGVCEAEENTMFTVTEVIHRREANKYVEGGYTLKGTVTVEDNPKTVWLFIRDKYLKQLIHPEQDA